MYEISPYATFAVGGEAATAATLDHTLQFRTFGHRDNDAPPHRPCRKHPQRHRERAEGEAKGKLLLFIHYLTKAKHNIFFNFLFKFNLLTATQSR